MILRSSRKVLVHTADRLRYATDLARYGLTRPRPLYDRRLQKVIREIRRSDWVPRANGCAGECGPDSVEQLRSSFNDTLAHRFRFFGKDEVFQTPGPECPLCGRHARLWGDAYRPIEWHADGLFGGCYPALDCPRSALNRTRSRRMEIKWPWELSRVQHLPALALAVHVLRDEEQTARAWREFQLQVVDWVGNNPHGLGVNWACPMDIGIRAANFAAANCLFGGFDNRSTPGWHRLFLRSMRCHLGLLQRVLTEGAGNNHAVAEAAALYLSAAFLPVLPQRAACLHRARTALTRQLERQVREDGTHFEGSLYYHLFTLEMWLYPAIIGAAMGDDFGPDYRTRLAKMQEVLSAMISSRLELPQVGDRDDGFLFKPVGADDDAIRVGHTLRLTEQHLRRVPSASVQEALCRILLPQDQEPRGAFSSAEGVRAFRDAGWVVVKQALWHLVLCTGGTSQDGGGHTHCDILSFSLFVDGLGFIVDPGTYLYTSNPSMRRHFRSAVSHNQPSFSEVKDKWTSTGCFCHYSKPATLYTIIRDDECTVITAETRDDGRQARRRISVPVRSGPVAVEDGLAGGKTGRIALCMHPDVAVSRIDPGAYRLERESLRLRLETEGFRFLTQRQLYSPRYACLLETTWLVFERPVGSFQCRWTVAME